MPALAGEPAPGAELEHVSVDARNVLPGIWRFPPYERLVQIRRQSGTLEMTYHAIGPQKSAGRNRCKRPSIAISIPAFTPSNSSVANASAPSTAAPTACWISFSV
ncbi:hypothetical protein GCM10008941_26170 [Rhizomicrobium palustre]